MRSTHASENDLLQAAPPCQALAAPVAWLACAFVLAALPAAAQTPELFADFSPTTVVATIDGAPLTLSELLLRFATLPQPVRDQYAARREGLHDFLSDTVANHIVAGEAEALGLERDPLFAELMKIHREEVLRDLYARRAVLSEIDEATVAARYAAQKTRAFDRQPLVRVRHILVTLTAEQPAADGGDDTVGEPAARAKIEKIRRRLTGEAEEPAVDFAEAARRWSEDASAADGGDIGWKTRGDLIPALAKAVFALAVGEISPVIETPLGLHLAQVVERRRGGLVPYELVRELLFQELVGERAVYFARGALEDRERLVSERQVELFPERLPW